MLIRFNFSLTVVSLIMQIAIFLSITWCYNLWKYIVAPLIINDLILSSQSYLLLSFLFFCFFVFVFFIILSFALAKSDLITFLFEFSTKPLTLKYS